MSMQTDGSNNNLLKWTFTADSYTGWQWVYMLAYTGWVKKV